MNWTKVTLNTVTVAGWLLVLWAALTPSGAAVSFETGRIGMMVALAGTLAWAVRRNSRPADEIFEAGRKVGRAEALLELGEGNVKRLDDYRSAV